MAAPVLLNWSQYSFSILQLCATGLGREMLRRKGIYALLRELDKARGGAGDSANRILAKEKALGNANTLLLLDSGSDDGNVDVLRALIGMLIRTEQDMGLDGLEADGPDGKLASIKQLGVEGEEGEDARTAAVDNSGRCKEEKM